ncbi:MAG: nucleoside recognition domain-containing protein, partial [Oscillospiraceae bacterium]
MKIFREKAFYKFLIPSSVGAFLFIIPLWYGGNATLPIAFAASFLLGILKGAAPHIIYSLIAFSCLATSINKLYKPSYIQQNVFLISLFNVTGFWFFVRIVGFIFATMTYFKIGAFAIISPTTGGLVLGDLLPILICVFFLSGLFLPLLLNYGLLDFAGVLLVKFMRPVFNLPGASALDCLASWLGDGSIGVLMTSRQYEQGYYSRREAAVIATNFSAVSVTFSLVVVSQVGLSHMFLPFYFTVAAAGLFASIVVPKLPPLSKIPDIYHKEIPHTEDVPLGISPIKYGLSRGMERAKNAPGVTGFLRDGAENVLNMYLSVVPVIMTFGTLALALAHYTPIFKILGLPF